MRAIKIDPANRTIEEIELVVDPNRSLSELRSIIGTDELELIPSTKASTCLPTFTGNRSRASVSATSTSP